MGDDGLYYREIFIRRGIESHVAEWQKSDRPLFRPGTDVSIVPSPGGEKVVISFSTSGQSFNDLLDDARLCRAEVSVGDFADRSVLKASLSRTISEEQLKAICF